MHGYACVLASLETIICDFKLPIKLTIPNAKKHIAEKVSDSKREELKTAMKETLDTINLKDLICEVSVSLLRYNTHYQSRPSLTKA